MRHVRYSIHTTVCVCVYVLFYFFFLSLILSLLRRLFFIFYFYVTFGLSTDAVIHQPPPTSDKRTLRVRSARALVEKKTNTYGV